MDARSIGDGTFVVGAHEDAGAAVAREASVYLVAEIFELQRPEVAFRLIGECLHLLAYAFVIDYSEFPRFAREV